MSPSDFLTWLTIPPRRTLVMGVLNVTPDSFSDGGRFASVDGAIEHARQMIADGADLIDIGGESTRPGSRRISAAEQTARVLPVIREVAKLGIATSVDTTLAPVAAAALDSGAAILNDISAGTEDPAMLMLAARWQCPFVLMHMQSEPGSMQIAPAYTNVVAEVRDYLLSRAAACENAGLARDRIVLDPGIGFGKTTEHNLRLLRELSALTASGYPVLVGTSRKGFIGKLLDQPDPARRVFGTAASVAWAVTQGASIVRVHDVRSMKEVVTILDAIAKAVPADVR